MRRRRRNPSDPHVTYWLVLGGLVVVGIAAAAWKAMSAADKARLLPVGGKPNDVAIGGPWTMLDVEARGRARDSRAAREGVEKGAIVAILLNAGAPLNMPYIVTVLGGSGRPDLPLNGIWSLAQPPAGPQTIDFGPEHIFTIAI